MEFFCGFLKTFLEGSVDRVIYRNFIVSQRLFIYCNLACAMLPNSSEIAEVDKLNQVKTVSQVRAIHLRALLCVEYTSEWAEMV